MQSTVPRDYVSANSTGQEKRARNINSQGLVTQYVREVALVQVCPTVFNALAMHIATRWENAFVSSSSQAKTAKHS